MTKMLRKLAGDRNGATAIEYGLIAAFIALAMVAALPTIKTNLGAKFTAVNYDGPSGWENAFIDYATKNGFADRLFALPVDEPGGDASAWSTLASRAESSWQKSIAPASP